MGERTMVEVPVRELTVGTWVGVGTAPSVEDMDWMLVVSAELRDDTSVRALLRGYDGRVAAVELDGADTVMVLHNENGPVGDEGTEFPGGAL